MIVNETTIYEHQGTRMSTTTGHIQPSTMTKIHAVQ